MASRVVQPYGRGEPEQLHGKMVTGNFFSLLGVRPILGRTFRAEEDQLGAAPVAILGEGLWKRRFGSIPDILGKSIAVNGKDYTIIGVVPSSFHLLRYQDSFFDDIFVPVGQWNNPLLRDRRFTLGLRTVGRLAAGITSLRPASKWTKSASELLPHTPTRPLEWASA